MNNNDFILWLEGFLDGADGNGLSSEQLKKIKEKLKETKNKSIGVPNTAPVIQPIWQQPHYIDPYHPYKITCNITGSGTTSTPGFAITTNPGYGSISYNPSTTTQMYPSGSAWHYTNGNKEQLEGIEQDLLLD